MTNIYGVLSNGSHIDISQSIKGAKRYATMNGYNIVTIRYNCGYIAEPISERINGKWKPINNN
jgi:hypothetical protein